ncbi:MAG TPA: CARDB domain-containing protein [Gaiellaceae bacterium]|nr:CARDB domain-containing protein [Gaiellaceae bacterium]
MFDREKADPQTDIEFDFFDESPTTESAPKKKGSPPGKRPRLPKRPPTPPGGPQLYRLGVLIAGAILLAVIFILVINNCRGDQKQSAYEGYIEDAGAVATESAELGTQLNQRLTTPGIRLEALRSDVEGLREQQEQILRRAQDLSPPGPLLEQQEALVETMQFRVNGLAGLARGLQLVAQTDDPQESGRNLANQAQRLVASDIVYADAFKAAAESVLEQQGVTNVAVPASVFVQNPEFGSPTFWTQTVQRLTQGPEAGGLRGNGIAGVRVQPGGQELVRGEDNTVEQSADLAFEVLVENSGESQETQVKVILIVRQDPQIRKEQVIDVINPGETKTVRFSNFDNLQFSTQTTLQVQVEPVQGEQNTDNNTREYPIIFTLAR